MSFENFEKFLQSIDSDLKKIFDYQKEYLFCKKGCSHCCQMGDYPMSELEFNYLLNGFNLLEDDLKEKIKQNINKLKDCNKDSYKCPFLIDNACSVYSHRPFVCRTFGVLTEDAKGNPSFPFCTTIGLNFSQLYNKEKECIEFDISMKDKFSVFPQVFRLSNNVVMNLPSAKELNIDFGNVNKMINFLEECELFN